MISGGTEDAIDGTAYATVIAGSGMLELATGSSAQWGITVTGIDGELVLLCHKCPVLADALATGASVELSREQLCNDDPDGRNRVLHVALRPNWRSRVAGSFRVFQGF